MVINYLFLPKMQLTDDGWWFKPLMMDSSVFLIWKYRFWVSVWFLVKYSDDR